MTREEIQAVMGTVKAVADAIQEAGSIPAGHLYALLMGHGCSLRSFEYLIGLLTSSENGKPLVRREGDMLVWNG